MESQESEVQRASAPPERHVPVRNDNFVLAMVVTGCKDIRSLEGLVEITEYVENHDNALCGVVGASSICKVE